MTGHTTASNKFAFKPQTYDFTSTLGSSTKYQFAFKSQISNLDSTRLGPCPPCTNPEIVEIKLVFLDLPLSARKKLDKNNLGWMNPPWVLVQYASKTLLSSENINENAEAIFFSGKYLGNKLERIAQFQRKVIWELWKMQIRQIVLNSRDYVGEGAYKLWKLDPNSQVLANVVFFETLNDWNNLFSTIIWYSYIRSPGFFRICNWILTPQFFKGPFRRLIELSGIIWKHLHWALMFSQINCINKSQITSWLIFSQINLYCINKHFHSQKYGMWTFESIDFWRQA